MIKIEPFYDTRTSTMTYVVYDPETRDAVILDPVLDYDPKASKTWTESVDRVVRFVREQQLVPRYILETHAHADHLSGSQRLKAAYPEARVAIGEHITDVQKLFRDIFDLPADFATDGRQFDQLLADGETVRAGSIEIDVIHTPGHTPACVTYKIDDAIFTGDTLFMPDMGTARCDFPGGSSETMYDSIQRLYELPDETRVFVGHDYQPGGREVAWETTIGEQKRDSIQIAEAVSKEDYVAVRDQRDATLEAPQLLFQSVQVNIDAGRLPEPSNNEVRYLRIPINVFRPEPQGEIDLQEVERAAELAG